MPLVNVSARLDAKGRRWGFLEIPMEVSLTVDGQQLPGSPVYGLKTFIKFLDTCTDASLRQTSLIMDGLGMKPHSAECAAMCFDPDTLAAFLDGRIVLK